MLGGLEDLFDFIGVVSIGKESEVGGKSRCKWHVFLFSIVILAVFGEMNKDVDGIYLLTRHLDFFKM